MIQVENVSKYFGQFQALDDVTFKIGKGEIVGFLGQNGAGKTTLMRVLTTFIPPTTGEVRVAGKDVITQSLEVRRKIGYLPENPPLYPHMSVRDYLAYAAQLKDVPHKDQAAQIDRVIERCQLKDVAHKMTRILSKGYKQRVGIAQAILNDPEVLILDEPTSGLDPVQIRQVRGLIKSLEQERTVILSTHILSEIEQIAHRVLIIKEGRIIADALLDDLIGQDDPQKSKTLEEAFFRHVQGSFEP